MDRINDNWLDYVGVMTSYYVTTSAVIADELYIYILIILHD